VPSEFARETTVVARGPGRYSASIAADWSVGAGPNGGFTAALLLRAAIAELDDRSMHPRSFTAHLLGAPTTGSCDLSARIGKRGRTAAFVHVTLEQDDVTLATATVVCVSERPDILRYATREMPDVPRPDALPDDTEVRVSVPGYLAHYEQRFATPPLRGDGTPSVIGWTRFVDPEPFDAVALVAIADSLPPPALACSTEIMGALTLDYTVHFRAALPHPATSDRGFVLAEFESNFAQEGLVEADGWIWAPDGTLLAQSRQLGLLRSIAGRERP
jgi:acyl-CoA thioesterase